MDAEESKLAAEAGENFLNLSLNPYPGRGIVAGLDQTGRYMVQVYWIMGRSENSRNRVFKADIMYGRLYTEAADPSKVKDPALIIYNAMRERSQYYIVSNGDQTDTVAEKIVPPILQLVLSDREYEPDAPNFTQRITAVHSLTPNVPWLQMSILRRSQFGEECDRLIYNYDLLTPGFGHCITTYMGDGDPLPSFRGDPLLMPINGDNTDDIIDAYWSALNEENRVSIALKMIEIESGKSYLQVINKYTQA